LAALAGFDFVSAAAASDAPDEIATARMAATMTVA
jgi:hypothetical protein